MLKLTGSPSVAKSNANVSDPISSETLNMEPRPITVAISTDSPTVISPPATDTLESPSHMVLVLGRRHSSVKSAPDKLGRLASSGFKKPGK